MSATDELKPWWERSPKRLPWEVANFADLGLTAKVDTEGGDPVILTSLELSDGREIQLKVEFPFEYPLRQPSVGVESGLIGPPHEVGGSLCLFDDAGSQWHPQRSAANLVNDNARRLLEDALIHGAKAVTINEEQIPDRVSRRYLVDTGRVVLVPNPFWADPPGDIEGGAFSLRGKDDRQLVEYVEHIGTADDELRAALLVGDSPQSAGRWAKVDKPPEGFQSGTTMLAAIRELAPNIFDQVQIDGEDKALEWVAITYPEEGPGRGQWTRGWTFIELTGPDTVPPGAAHMPQVQALTPEERALRLPDLAGLDQANIVLVGLGSLGSSIAIELAKAGTGRMVFFDPDEYDVNNAVRHELDVWLTGTRKTVGMAIACRNMNPFVDIEIESRSVGVGRAGAERFLQRLDGATLVVETTGSRAVTRILHRYCTGANVPLLSASLTRGSRGGDMVLLQPDSCFDCFLLAQQNGEIPSPPKGEQPLVIPVGCSDPAFSGSGFDASDLAADVARMAIRATALTKYPALDHNWAVVSFTEQPRWQQGVLDPNPACGHSQ